MIYDESHCNKYKTQLIKNLQAKSTGMLYKKKNDQEKITL